REARTSAIAVPPRLPSSPPPGGSTSRRTTSPESSCRRCSELRSGRASAGAAVVAQTRIVRRNLAVRFISRQCRTRHRAVKVAATIGGMLAVAAAASDRPDWPPFVPPRSSLSAGVVSSIERVWRAPTLTRTVQGEPAPVPLKIYDAFLDSPDVTAAAARQLKLARYQVRMMGGGWYEADDGQGAHGIYRVRVRTPERHVILSWGHHSGAILGTISGTALTVLEFEDRDHQVSQKLTTYVLIENRVAAA